MGSKAQTNIMTVKSLIIAFVLIFAIDFSNSKVATNRPTVSQYPPTSTYPPSSMTKSSFPPSSSTYHSSTYPPSSTTKSSFPPSSNTYHSITYPPSSTTKPSFPPTTSTSSTSFSTTTHSDQGCSNVNLSFSSGGYFPDGRITCYQENGTEFQLHNEGTINSNDVVLIAPGVSCIFLSSGHLSDGLVMEFFCDENKWRVSVIQV